MRTAIENSTAFKLTLFLEARNTLGLNSGTSVSGELEKHVLAVVLSSGMMMLVVVRQKERGGFT